ncbi:MAG: (d)CMP kinase [Bacillota bacterium]
MKIAIDGPAGAGKSSAAKEVARRLGYKYLDTGAMYRAITVKALAKNIDLQDEGELVALAKSCELEVKDDVEKGNLILLNGKDITEEIRQPHVNQVVSIVAASPGVRRELVHLQRKAALNSGNIVMEGRDIGTNVLTDADFKFYLSATVEERAKRRWLEMREKGIEISFNELREEISMRDRLDQEREDSPLCIASDACVIDTTPYSLAEVVDKILSIISGD